MKKYLSFLLSAVLLLSLASCSSEGENESITKKEIQSAEKASIEEITAAKEENISEAESTYIGSVYSFTGHVAKKEDDFIELIPYGHFDSVTAYMPKSDIDSLSENEIINIAGEISKLDCGDGKLAELSKSRYVGSTVSVHGWVNAIETTEDGKCIASVIDLPYGNSNKKVVWKFELDRTEKSDTDRGKYGNTYLYSGTFVTVRCNAEFTYFEPSRGAQSSDSQVQVGKIVDLSIN